MYRNLLTVKRKYNLYHTRFYFKLCYIDSLQKSYRFFYPLSRKPEKNSTSKELGKRTSAPFSPYDVMHVFGYDGMRLDCNPSTFPVSVITE